MNIYIDESGSINNHLKSMPFVIALIHVHDNKKLKRVYKRFVSSNYSQLFSLDADKIDSLTGQVSKTGGKMFHDGKFHELKGAQFDRTMKLKFADFFSQSHYFDVYYIKLDNSRISKAFCKSTARAFNYLIRLALSYFIENGYLPIEDCHLQLDERNEKPESKYFLEDYLNTELTIGGSLPMSFTVDYFDSASNSLIQVADVFSNLYYSQLMTKAYTDTFQQLRTLGILKAVFEFPMSE